MYRFPSDLDLSHLIGCEVVEVSHVPYNLLFNLEPENRINICGHWRVLDENGNINDEGDFIEPKKAYSTHLLLTRKVKSYKIVDPTILSIIFDNEWILQIIDDSEKYECCHISPNIYI